MISPMTDEAKLQRFGEIVARRRDELRLTLRAVEATGGPSAKRMQQVEKGAGPVPAMSTLTKIEKALKWTKGSAATALAGGEPEPVQPRGARKSAPPSEDDIRRRVRLEMELERVGVSNVATRTHQVDTSGGLALPAPVVDQILEVLKQMPSAAD